MKKTIIILMLLFSVKAFAQTAALPVYACVQNGTQAVTSGLKSSNYQLGVVPYCSVSVYLTGTTTIATTTPQSPFRANKDGSIPPIYAAVNQGYDVVLSGGISPNVYLSPVTLTDMYPGFSFSGISRLIAGTNITLSPPGGTGNVTISARGVVLMQQVVPPVSGQYVIVYPTTYTGNWAGQSAAGGGWIDPPTCVGTSTGTASWGNPVLPSYVLPSNVTAVYAFALTREYVNPSYGGCFGQPTTPAPASFSVGASGTSSVLTPTSTPIWAPVQNAVLLPSVTGENFASQTFSASYGASTPIRTGSTGNVTLGWIVYYTGSAPPADTDTQVELPLYYNSVENSLSISPLSEFPGSALVPTTVANLPWAAASNGWVVPITDALTSTSCATGGGFNYVQCKSDGSIWSVYTPQLGTLASLNVSGAITAGSVQDAGASSTSGHSCLQIDTTGVISNTGAGCGGSGSSVTQIIAGTNITLSPSGGTGNVTISATGGSSSGLLAGANVVITGDSLMQDDSGNTLGLTTTSTAISCSSTGLCIVTDSNTYTPGQWIYFSPSISPSCLGNGPTGAGYYGTGNRTYQVLSEGLSTSQFEIQTGCISITGSGGSIEDASYFLPTQMSEQPAFKDANSWQLRNGVDAAGIYGGFTGLVCSQATNFNAMFGDLLPSVTGKPLYFIEESGGTNDHAYGESEATLQGCFQSFWAQAHAAGAFIVQGLIPLHFNDSYISDMNTWLIAQGVKNTTTVASGEYWDYPGPDWRIITSGVGNPLSFSAISQLVSLYDASLESPGTSGFTLTGCSPENNIPCLNSSNTYTGSNIFTGNTTFAVDTDNGMVVVDSNGSSSSLRIEAHMSGIPTVRAANSGDNGTSTEQGQFLGFYNYDGNFENTGLNIVAVPGQAAFGFLENTLGVGNKPTACLTISATLAKEIDFGNCSIQGDSSGSAKMNGLTLNAPLTSCTGQPSGTVVAIGWVSGTTAGVLTVCP